MEPLKNQFFRKATERASGYLRNNRRLAGLLTSASYKLRNADMGRLNPKRFIDRVRIFMRMIKAYAKGSYRELPWKKMLLITGAVVYFVTPIDMIPDFIPVSGLLDDFTVIVWVYNTLRLEIEDFMAWEEQRELLA